MFVLKCTRDDSFCKVDDNEVIFSKDSPPNQGETIKFQWNGKEELGEIIMMSDNIKKINTKFEQIKKSLQERPRTPSMSPERTDESQVPLKRSRKPNSKYTSESHKNLEVLKQPKKVPVPKQKVKEDNKKKSRNYNQEDSVTESDSTDVDSSLKDLLDDRRDSSESDKSFENLKESCADDNDKENDPSTSRSFKKSGHNDKIPVGVTDDDDCNDPDLYGKDWPGEKMVKLIDKIYCKETEHKICKTQCSQAFHVVQRMIPGFFKPDGYLDATLTGQAPRAHLQAGKPTPVKAMNALAKNEIIEFAMALAKTKGWKTKKGVPQTEEQLRSVMSQRIGELKSTHKANNVEAKS